MSRVIAGVLVAMTLLAGCGADGEPIPPNRNAQAADLTSVPE